MNTAGLLKISCQTMLLSYVAATLWMPVCVQAGDLGIKSETLLRIYERETTARSEATVAPLYEFLELDYDPAILPGISFHGYGWGRIDAGDGGYFDQDTDGELQYGYMEYSAGWNGFTARIGRHHIFSGVANESLDGLSLQSDLTTFFTLCAYGGYPVGLDLASGNGGDSLVGGRIEYHRGTLYKVGASYKKVDNDGHAFEETAGLDLALALPGGVSLYGLSTRNQVTDQWAEHSYDLRANLLDLFIHPFVQRYRYEDYFNGDAASPGPFQYLADTGETLTVVGCDLSYHRSVTWEPAVEVRNYQYDLRDDSSRFYSAQLNWFGDHLTQAGGEIGYMDGYAPENTYLLTRVFAYQDLILEKLPPGFVSADLMQVSYDQEISGTDSALFASLGCGIKVLEETMQFALTVDYQDGPHLKNDVRGLFITSYTFGR